MTCANFVCAFAEFNKGKIFCGWGGDCDVTRSLSCHKYKYLKCDLCGYYNKCFKQREKGIFYSAKEGNYIPAYTAQFVKAAEQNDLINAKRDIYSTACNNYRQGYKPETTVKQLYDKYSKSFPQFTKDFLREAVYKSILKYLENES